jgi:aspartyl-tRNA synthetase
LNIDKVGETATLCGWVDTIRDFGGVTFIDLRDRYGRTQVVFNPDASSDVLELVPKLRNEYVIRQRSQTA